MGERSTIDAKMTSHVFCTNLLIISDFSTMKECKSSLFKLKLFCEIKIFLVIFFIHKNFIVFNFPRTKIFPSSTRANKMEVSSMTRIYELPGEKRNQISTILKIILASNIILKPIKKLKKKTK